MVYDSVTWRLLHEQFASGAFNAARLPSLLITGESSPALGGPSIREYRFLYGSNCSSGLPDAFRSYFSKMVFLEISVASKEDLFGFRLLRSFVFNPR